MALAFMLIVINAVGDPAPGVWVDAFAVARSGFQQAVISGASAVGAAREVQNDFEKRYPMAWDWLLQDLGPDWTPLLANGQGTKVETALIESVLGEMPGTPGHFREQLDLLVAAKAASGDLRWLSLYHEACLARRARRLETLLANHTSFVYASHFNLGGSHYAYTEALSDAAHERNFLPGSALRLLEMEGTEGRVTTLLEDPDGVIRNPDVSHDGQRVLFAWKQSDRGDDYSLYEMDVPTGTVRSLLKAPGHADYEGVYLPNGDIMFSSTRCVQTVDCWWTEVSNLYVVDKDGGSLRRVGFDQVHTNFPSVLEDGRVIYTRWDYNDRGQIFPQGLFQMNPDGTGQTEYYGNNSWFPTTLIHARGIPGSRRVMAVFTGHHSFQAGKLGVLDPAQGTQENQGARLIAPPRETPAVRVDSYGQDGELFQFPYPFSEDEFLVSYHPLGWDGDRMGNPRFKVYFMRADGRRELLAADPDRSCNQPVPLSPRQAPLPRPGMVDYRQDTGVYYIQDVHEGPGLEGVPRGTVRELRVVALEYRAAGIGSNTNAGPAGGAMVSTPVAVGNGSWDVKRILGSATVHEDGSAMFRAPARTPVYFQALDAEGRAVQTMRSWSTLQPGELMSCVGCHEDKNSAPTVTAHTTQAMRHGVEELRPFHETPRGFSFAREIQPILDRHCTRCHNDRSAMAPGLAVLADDRSIALIERCSSWKYVFADPGPGWETEAFDDSGWETGQAGFGVEGTPGGPVHTHWPTQTIWLRGTFEAPPDVSFRRLAFVVAHDEDVRIYVNGTLAASADGFTTRYVPLPVSGPGRAAIRPGKNTIAVSCLDTGGGRYIDVALFMSAPPADGDVAFSLLAESVLDTSAKRYWTDSYLALTNATTAGSSDVSEGNDLRSGADFRGTSNAQVNWVSPQSEPSMLPPGRFGSTQSGLLGMLRSGHEGVALDEHELRTIAAWIDLLVPFCGAYDEANAWSDEEQATHDRLQEKRRAMEAVEKEGIASLY